MRSFTTTSLKRTCKKCDKEFIASRPRQIYCSVQCQKNGSRSINCVSSPTKFVGIDGEGMTLDKGEWNERHAYVLLGVGQDQIENVDGLHWKEIFEFLYAHYEPNTAFVGFFLAYDFTQWFKTLPEERARRLLTKPGIASRKHRIAGRQPHPVTHDGWAFDILGNKRFRLRPKRCNCKDSTCKCPQEPWMYICDAGPFFQTSFLNVINPKNWNEPIVSEEEYATLERGKSLRSTAILDNDMRYYNRLENKILARVMAQLDNGLHSMGVSLAPHKWFGPGQAAQEWMRGRAPKAREVRKWVPEWFMDAAQKSYFGGWFEIMMHGILPGKSWEYDINSAYPYIISQLPCLQHGDYTKGTGKPSVDDNEICLVRATVWTHSPWQHRAKKDKMFIGAMLHRDHDGRITRPQATEGWFWWHELQAATKTKCVSTISDDRYYEWIKYRPCNCQAPMWQVKNLYKLRLDVGKKSPIGMAAKLVYNSMYGKFAQSVGTPLYGNPIYASLITAGCRTMILEAIASHPKGKQDVCMVATDAVFFRSPHPNLPTSTALGAWDGQERSRLTLFKPGVYWDDNGREEMVQGKHPHFKARGINAREFGTQLARIDQEFEEWDPANPPTISLLGLPVKGWPSVDFHTGFAMISALQALIRKKWELAGYVHEKDLSQNANPYDKRADVYYDEEYGLYRSEPHPAFINAQKDKETGEWTTKLICDSVGYKKQFGQDDPFSDETRESFGITPDGYVSDHFSWIMKS